MTERTLAYGSDVVVEMLNRLDIEHVAFNPGASFRGLHDSLVNRPGAPEILLTTHENLSVQIAHGYAKASGRPMAAVLHDVVGLLNGSMALFYAHTDRVPLLAIGGSGPGDAARKRPEIDWRHTANVQGNAVRAFTKWDDEPRSVAHLADSLLRGYRIATNGPTGPVYVTADVELQEQPLGDGEGAAVLPDPQAYAAPTGMAPDPAALARVVELLLHAEKPIIVADFAGRDPACFELLPRLAETAGAGVIDTQTRLSMPNRHRLDVSGSDDAVRDADLILLLDPKDPGRTLNERPREDRIVRSRLRDDVRLVELGFGDLELSDWVQHEGAFRPAALRVTCDTQIALPLLVGAVVRAAAEEPSERAARREARRREIAAAHDALNAGWQAEAAAAADRSPVATAQLAASAWNVVRDHDWVLTAGDASGWTRRLWDMDRSYRHPGQSLGTATQIGISLGVALAHRGSGKLVVDLQPDGDLLYHPGAMWTAVAHKIPFLAVMFDNRAYYNDWGHQVTMANVRGTPVENARFGIALDTPATDFATLAKAFGWWSEGPIEDPAAVEAAVRRAADVVLTESRPALVDVVCEYR